MNKLLHLLTGALLLASSTLMAEPTDAPASPVTPAPVVTVPKPALARPAPAPAPTVSKPVTVAPAVAPATTSAQTPVATTVGAAAGLVAPATPTPVVVTPEQRKQQELLVNAERVDKANRELLARNQELQLQLENLSIQNNVLKRDRSNEGIWKGAGAVIVGFLMGWFFSGAGRRKSSW